ncbi:hypothetical protein AA101099_1757 [Neoasaia chiangmaiensis NBRC 101099]|uniref:Uncharacterized protein n=1 Tax=Neoasaia chiangmaiensis TaxID=320497 RepID=A0A1U9KR35_9PROT|nr:hypothetical protein [Neoasaia chiangmaiensis]AQS88288.1 hypothetical protein A0U93_10410 [Neoasaia chiangmaiensis]GBR39643.1 hypothetical protein AA101099_1757 [Neoasaia chiangmaiensis NBRC 101099]GEN14678.1 hypothetical protein NCH01_11090 [Neoasaia chiangmaiensis]
MSFLSELWPSLQPYVAQHPWLAPVIAGCLVCSFVLRGLSVAWAQYRNQQHQAEEFDHTQQMDLLRALRDQRDAAMRDLTSERKAHEATRRRADQAEDALRAFQARTPS